MANMRSARVSDITDPADFQRYFENWKRNI